MVRLARTVDGRAMIGDDEGFVPLEAVAPRRETITSVLPLAARNELTLARSTPAERIPASHLSFGQPLEHLGKLWGIGLNYAEHAADLDETQPTEPASFMKPTTAAVGPGGPIRLPPRDQTDRVTAEAELGVVIGRTCSNITREGAANVIAGYVPLIDMTAEDILEQNPRYLTRSKSFDSFLVIGPSIVTTDELESLSDVTVRTIVNDTVTAENTIDNMMVKPTALVSYHSRVMTLEPGDIISTGTPGAHVIRPGDVVEATVDDVGSVSASVVGR